MRCNARREHAVVGGIAPATSVSLVVSPVWASCCSCGSAATAVVAGIDAYVLFVRVVTAATGGTMRKERCDSRRSAAGFVCPGPNDAFVTALLDPMNITVHLVDPTLACPEVRVELWTNLAHSLAPQPELAADVMEETALLSLTSEQELYVPKSSSGRRGVGPHCRRLTLNAARTCVWFPRAALCSVATVVCPGARCVWQRRGVGWRLTWCYSRLGRGLAPRAFRVSQWCCCMC